MDEQDRQDIVDRLEAVGRPDLANRYKHLGGKHNQRTHGWRYARGGDEAARLHAARRSMRGTSAEQRATYRKRAGMPEAKPLERKQPQPKASRYPEVPHFSTAKEYASWVVEGGHVKAANFDKIHPDDARDIARSLVENGTDFPRARNGLDYVGTAAGYRKLIRGDAEQAWEKRRLDRERWGIKERAGDKERFIRKYESQNGARMQANTWAQAVSQGGGRARILIGTSMEASRRDRFAKEMKQAVEQGFHPKGTGSFKSIIDHEYGHVIDFSHRNLPGSSYIEQRNSIMSAIYSWGKVGLSKELSAYAASKTAEVWAEAWSEFRNSPNPRPAATEIGKLMLELGKL